MTGRCPMFLRSSRAWASRPSVVLREQAEVESALMVGRTDADLLLAIRDGDASAWNELVARHQQRLWSIARARGLDAGVASKLVIDPHRQLARVAWKHRRSGDER